MSEQPSLGNPAIEQQRKSLKDLGIEVVDEIGTMPVIQGKGFLADTRKESGYALVPMRIILGNDIDLPSQAPSSARYPSTDKPSEAALISDIAHVAMVRTIGEAGYDSTGYFPNERELNKKIIDTCEESERRGLPPPFTIVTAEGGIWKDGKHILVPHEGISYYTEMVLGKIQEKYYSDYPLDPIILLAACNESNLGEHADITPPERINLVYTDGLASILNSGQPHYKFTDGSLPIKE